MDKPVFDKSKLPSRHVTEGPARAPHRSYFYAMGITEEEIHQPWVGVATCWNEAAPCNIALNRQAQIQSWRCVKSQTTVRPTACSLQALHSLNLSQEQCSIMSSCAYR